MTENMRKFLKHPAKDGAPAAKSNAKPAAELDDNALDQVAGGMGRETCLVCQRCGMAFYGRTSEEAYNEMRIHMNHEHNEDFSE